MIHSPSDSEIYYASSEDPTIFTKGTPCTFCEDEPFEVGSVTVLHEKGTFYMITYGSTNKVFNIYTSNNRTAWKNKGLVFDREVFDKLGGFVKINGPYLSKDSDKYRLYFQVNHQLTMLIITTSTPPNRLPHR